jgi:hypothetical protein
MYHRLPGTQYKRLTKTTYNDSSLLKIHSVADSNGLAAEHSRHSLLQLIQQHLPARSMVNCHQMHPFQHSQKS